MRERFHQRPAPSAQPRVPGSAVNQSKRRSSACGQIGEVRQAVNEARQEAGKTLCPGCQARLGGRCPAGRGQGTDPCARVFERHRVPLWSGLVVRVHPCAPVPWMRTVQGCPMMVVWAGRRSTGAGARRCRPAALLYSRADRCAKLPGGLARRIWAARLFRPDGINAMHQSSGTSVGGAAVGAFAPARIGLGRCRG